MNHKWVIILLSLLGTKAAKYRKDWSKLNLEQLDEEWKNGDEPEELKSSSDELYELYETQKKKMLQSYNKSDDVLGPDEMAQIENAGKPAMIFTTMEKNVKNILDKEKKKTWVFDELAQICEEWEYRLRIASLEIQCYPMVPDRILVTIQKGWFAKGVVDYLTQQTILAEVKWNNKIVRPSLNQNNT